MARPTWTDDEVVQVMTAQGYILRCEADMPGFARLKPFVDEFWEVRVRHAVAKEPARRAKVRARLIRLSARICRAKIEWPQTAREDRDRVVVETESSRRSLRPVVRRLRRRHV